MRAFPDFGPVYEETGRTSLRKAAINRASRRSCRQYKYSLSSGAPPSEREHTQIRVARHFLAGDNAHAQVARDGLADGFPAADLHRGSRRDACLGHHRFGHGAGGRSNFAHQQPALRQHAHRHARPVGQRVVAMHHQHQRIACQFNAQKARVVHALRRRRHVNAVLLQRFEHLHRIAGFDAHVDAGMAFAEAIHDVEHVIRRRRADAQVPRAHVTGVAQKEVDLGFLAHELVHQRHQPHTGIRQGQPAPAPVEQLHAISLLQGADLRSDGRLRQAKLLGCQRDAAQAGDHEERFELRDEHRRVTY